MRLLGTAFGRPILALALLVAGMAGAQGYCDEVPDYANGMTLAYCEAFSGPGTSPEEFGFTVDHAGDDSNVEWSLVDDEDGKRWLRAQNDDWTLAYLENDAMANADRLIIEYTVAGDDGGWLRSALIFLSTAPTGPYGETGFYAFNGQRFIIRVIEDGAYAWRDGTADLQRGSREPTLVRIHYDRTAGEMDLFLDGERGSGFPWRLQEQDRFGGPEHRYLAFQTENAATKWTDLRIWAD